MSSSTKTTIITAVFCMIGAASISAFPFFSGFVSKSLISSAAAQEHMTLVWLLLLVASAGVMERSGIKIPYFSFFGHDFGIRCKEAPFNMLLAMGITATLCLFLAFPGGSLFGYATLYDLLPNDVDYVPYTADHVVTQFQLLLFAALAFGLLIRRKLYPLEVRSINLDTDWIYRKLVPSVGGVTLRAGWRVWEGSVAAVRQGLEGLASGFIYRFHGPGSFFARTWRTGQIAFFAALMLAGYLVLYLWELS